MTKIVPFADVVAEIINGLIPSARKLSSLEKSKDAGLEAKMSADLNLTAELSSQGTWEVGIAPVGLLDSLVDINAGVNAEKAGTMAALGTVHIEMTVDFRSDGKSGLWGLITGTK